MWGGCAWCSESIGDSLWRFGVGLVVSSISSSSPHASGGGGGGAEKRGDSMACISFSGSARSGHPFLLVRFVVVLCAVPWFSGDGVLVMSSCGLLLVGGLKHCVHVVFLYCLYVNQRYDYDYYDKHHNCICI